MCSSGQSTKVMKQQETVRAVGMVRDLDRGEQMLTVFKYTRNKCRRAGRI